MKNPFEIFFPSIFDERSAKQAAQYGFVAAGFIALVSALSLTIAVIDAQGVDATSIAMQVITDVAPIAILGYFIHRMSRVASVLAFALCLFEIIYKFSEHGTVGILPVLLLFFLSAIRGTFFYQRLMKEQIK